LAFRECKSGLARVHLQNALQIMDLATKCPLCALIQESLFEDLKSNRVDGIELLELELSEDLLFHMPKTNM